MSTEGKISATTWEQYKYATLTNAYLLPMGNNHCTADLLFDW